MPRPLVAALVVILVGMAWLGSTADSQLRGLDPSARATSSSLDRAGDAVQGAAARVDTRTLVPGQPGAAPAVSSGPSTRFAAVDDLTLALPDRDTVLVAFHEAAQADALSLTPVGTIVANGNPDNFSPPPDVPGTRYAVLEPIQAVRGPTSAVDVVLPAGSAVRAPVTGTVVDVSEYALRSGVRDWRVVLEPEERSELRVVVQHLEAPSVTVGEEVQAGRSELARVRALPFPTIVDEVNPEGLPHARIVVRPGVTEQPLDPNAPALDPDGFPS